jgi:hypothetical protein
MMVYVAGASGELEHIEWWMAKLRAACIVITYDWTQNIRYSKNNPIDDKYRKDCALLELQGIDESDLVWLLLPTVPSIGCYVEMGYALGKQKLLVLSGLITPNNIFAMLGKEHISIHHPYHKDAFEAIIQLHKVHQL